MATMNIKDPRVHAMAHDLAALQGTTATAAVRAALEEALLRARGQAVDRTAALRRLQDQTADTRSLWPDEADLFDEQGLPR